MEIKLHGRIAAIPAAAWDGLVSGADPFVRHSFLHLLEESGSAVEETGWQPLHLTVEEAGAIRAAMPLYAKSHSWGEYVFDHGWADAFERAGGRYYPKLQAAVPFTPVPGPRLLTGSQGVADGTVAALIAALASLPERLGASSLHVTFCPEEQARGLAEAGFLLRQGIQYHWHNRGYRDFQDFLDGLRSAKKKMIRKEREAVRRAGITVRAVAGDELRGELLRTFYGFYLATVDKRWGSAYLTRRFFQGLAGDLARNVVLVVAERDGRIVGMALNLLGGDTLYGRIWGALEEYPFLHFECCYYAAIDFAIGRGLARVEAGAQGQHKLLRGYEPVPTWSAHLIADPGLRAAIRRFLEQERRAMAEQTAELREHLPYHRADECA